MLKLQLKRDLPKEKTKGLCLGYKKIELLFNLGPFPGGGDCIIVKADGKRMMVNSNDVIADLEAYEIT